ncbi:nucleoside hydrolase [Lachnospiraceae bacterium 62-35]
MEKTKVILDVDTGSDDAIAIMEAILHPALDVLAITTVNGNKPLPNTTENTLRVIDLMGVGDKVPVYMGCEDPMVAELLPDRHAESRQAPQKKVVDGEVIEYHSEHLDMIPPSHTKAQEKRAVPFLIDTLMASEGDITLIPVGPLTNIALAMRAEPRIKEKIKKIVIMGGGHNKTNRTCAAEFNIWKDPEAAQIVFTSGCDVLLVPLDATHAGDVTMAESQAIREIGTPIAAAVADLLDQRIKAYDMFQPQKIAGSTPPHDALAVASVIDPDVLRDVQFRRVDVDFSGGICDGRTMVDPRVYPDNPPNIHIALDCDRERFVKLLTDTIALSKDPDWWEKQAK